MIPFRVMMMMMHFFSMMSAIMCSPVLLPLASPSSLQKKKERDFKVFNCQHASSSEKLLCASQVQSADPGVCSRCRHTAPSTASCICVRSIPRRQVANYSAAPSRAGSCSVQQRWPTCISLTQAADDLTPRHTALFVCRRQIYFPKYGRDPLCRVCSDCSPCRRGDVCSV